MCDVPDLDLPLAERGAAPGGLAPLLAASREVLSGVTPAMLRSSYESLSARYHSGRPASRALSHDEVLSYVAARLPATFAATNSVLRELAMRAPQFAPASMLDVGAGPGAASWAASEIFQTLRDHVLLERSAEMVRLGRELLVHAPRPPLRDATWEIVDAATASADSDLVVAGYVLGELDPALRRDSVLSWWDLTKGALVLIEPGTPEGASRIISARADLIAAGATLLAPCPHEGPCPLSGDDWCHFAARVGRSALHRALKDAERSFEDEKFSYAIFAKSGTPARGRVLRRPMRRTGLVRLAVCGPEGIADRTITRRDRPRFEAVRHVEWGDAVDLG